MSGGVWVVDRQPSLPSFYSALVSSLRVQQTRGAFRTAYAGTLKPCRHRRTARPARGPARPLSQSGARAAGPSSRTSLARAAIALRDTVYPTSIFLSGLPLAGTTASCSICAARVFKLTDCVGSVERLAWAQAAGRPWTEATCAVETKAGAYTRQLSSST